LGEAQQPGVTTVQTLNISLPDAMKQYADERVASGEYGSVSEYLSELVRADQLSQVREQLEQELLDALRSGDPVEVTPAMWDDLRQRIQARAQARHAGRP
jgi:antitoxin ParD1/3/4